MEVKERVLDGRSTNVVCAAEITSCDIDPCELHLRYGSGDEEACAQDGNQSGKTLHTEQSI